MAETANVLLVANEGGVRTITLNRPEVLNAFNNELLSALAKALREAEKEKAVRCLIMTGAGRAFSSGQDLVDVKDRYAGSDPIELGAHLRDRYNPVILAIRQMEKPVIAAVNGVAAGAGCSLALACDIRVATVSASFIQAFINVGLIPDSGATFALPRLVGPARAFELAVTGRKVKAEEALAMGLVNQVIPDDQLLVETMNLARKLASSPTRAIGLTKRAINASGLNRLDVQLDYEAMLQTVAGQSQDHREGVTAFMEKRPPQFRGE